MLAESNTILQHCGIIVLAAGSSSRLGRPKQLLPYKGNTLMHHVLTTAVDTGIQPIVVVTGSNAAMIATAIAALPVDTVVNENWQSGMASSIVCGLNFITTHYPKVDGVIFMMSDQPFVHAALLKELLNTQQQTGKQLVASCYNNTIGVPALFCSNIFPELLQLTGDAGARKIVQQYHNGVATVSFPQGSIDIDTAEDYEKLLGEG